MSLAAFASQLDPVTTTTIEVLSYGERKPTGLFIEGYTPDSTEWTAIDKEVKGAPKSQKLHMQKNGSFIELPAETKDHPDAHVIAVKAIFGGYQMTGDKKKELSESDLTALRTNMLGPWDDVLQQWQEHIDERKNFLDKPENPPKTG